MRRIAKPVETRVVFEIATKKNMLAHTDIVIELFRKAVEALELELGQQGYFCCSMYGGKLYYYKLDEKGLKSLKKRLIQVENPIEEIAMECMNDPYAMDYQHCPVSINWNFNTKSQILYPYSNIENSCDTFRFDLDKTMYVSMKSKQKLMDLFFEATVKIDAVYANCNLSSYMDPFAYITPYESVFGFGRYDRRRFLSHLDRYVRGWFWGNILSEKHIEKLDGIGVIRKSAPFEIIKEFTTESGNQLVYLQLTDDILDCSQSLIDQADAYLRPLFYTKEAIFSVHQSYKIFPDGTDYIPEDMPTYTEAEFDKITGLTQAERDEWDREKKEQFYAERAKMVSPPPLPKEKQEIMDRINAMMKEKIDGWMKQSTADYFDIKEMEALYKKFEPKVMKAVKAEISKYKEIEFSQEEKDEMIGYAVGYLDHYINL